ncbi:MAG: hypothetical protein AB7N76_28990 [Planctomycetota bacterium]
MKAREQELAAERAATGLNQLSAAIKEEAGGDKAKLEVAKELTIAAEQQDWQKAKQLIDQHKVTVKWLGSGTINTKLGEVIRAQKNFEDVRTFAETKLGVGRGPEKPEKPEKPGGTP